MLTRRVRSQQVIPLRYGGFQVEANLLTTAGFTLGRVQKNLQRFKRWRRRFVVGHKVCHHPVVLKAERLYPGRHIHLSIHADIAKVLAKLAPHRFQGLFVPLQTFGQHHVNLLKPASCLQGLGQQRNGLLVFIVGEQLHPPATDHIGVIRNQLLSLAYAPVRIASAA